MDTKMHLLSEDMLMISKPNALPETPASVTNTPEDRMSVWGHDQALPGQQQ